MIGKTISHYKIMEKLGGRITLSILVLAIVLGVTILSAQQTSTSARYFPPKGAWEKRSPAELGFNPAKLDAAIQYSIESQNKNTRNLAEDIPNTYRNEADFDIVKGDHKRWE